VKKRSFIVVILIASMLLYGLATVLTRVGAVSVYSVTINWTPVVTTGYPFVNVAGTPYTIPTTLSGLSYGQILNFTAYIPVWDGVKLKLYIFANWTDTAAVPPLPTTSQSFNYTVVGDDTVTANFKWFWSGDLLFSGTVDIFSAVKFASVFGTTPTSPSWDLYADILHDGVVDIFDAVALASNFGKTSPYTSF
jgi:hypothetical protein